MSWRLGALNYEDAGPIDCACVLLLCVQRERETLN